MLSEEDHELYTLRNMARPLGYHVGRHEFFDVTRGGGPFYVMIAKSNPLYEASKRNPTLMKYSTAEEVEEFLNRAADNYAA